MSTRHKVHTLIIRLFILLNTVFLYGCTSDIEDEQFELIPGDFPKLRDVPCRPDHPSMGSFHDIENKLIQKREEALVDHQKNMNQLKK